MGEGNGCHEENGVREAGGRRGGVTAVFTGDGNLWVKTSSTTSKDHQEDREVITLGFWLVVRDSTLRGDHEDHGATQRVLERTHSRVWTWVR